MSRGRPRHQASRRRTYSSRQRDLRDRQAHAAERVVRPTADRFGALEADEQSDYEPQAGWQGPLSGRASAA